MLQDGDERPLVDGVLVCERCGMQHLTINRQQSCPGHISSGPKRGRPCSHERGFGTDHKGVGGCKFHAGNTPTARKAAAKIQIENEARQLLGLNEWEPISDPFSALSDLAGKAMALQEIMHHKVEELASLRQDGGVTGEKIDVTYEAWERAFDRVLKVLHGMSRMDLDAKIAALHAAIDASTAKIVQSAMQKALMSVDIPQATRATIMAEFGNRLRVEGTKEKPAAIDAGD